MAVKEKALKRLAEKMDAAGIPFAVGGQWRDCQLGRADTWHELEILVSPESYAAGEKVLSRLGMPGEGEGAYHFDGTEVLLRRAGTADFQGEERTVLGRGVRLAKEDA